jgi:hypothetical protein
MGVGNEETWPSLLEKEIGLPMGWSDLQVVNAGVCGYNLKQYRALIQNKILALSPNMIILGLMSNDLKRTYGFEDGYIVFPGVKGSLPIPGKRWLQTHSYLYQYLVLRYHQLLDRFFSAGGSQAKDRSEKNDSDWMKAFPILQDIDEMCDQRGIRLICVRFLFNEKVIEEICKTLGIPLIDVRLGKGMFLPDGHPNVSGHQEIGELIAQYIKRHIMAGKAVL